MSCDNYLYIFVSLNQFLFKIKIPVLNFQVLLRKEHSLCINMKNILSSIICLKGEKQKETSADSEDYLSKSIGVFGLWHAGICVAAAVTRFLVMWNMTAILFLTPDTEFECKEVKVIRNITSNTCYDDCLKYEYYNQGLPTTLISDYNLICDRQWLGSLAQAVLMLGLLVGTFVFGWISDR